MSNANTIQCPCGEFILTSYPNGVSKIRSMLLVFGNGSVLCKCRRCKKEHALPIHIEIDKKSAGSVHFLIDEGGL